MTEIRSRKFKKFFEEHYVTWSNETKLGLRDLADRCGVSSSYLGQVKNYGRIPGQPVLILLAHNFQLEEPEEILRLANIKENWPYPKDIKLTKSEAVTPGFLNLSIDMKGFQGAIREIVKSELSPRSIQQLTAGESLKVGVNDAQSGFIVDNHFQPFKDLINLISIGMRTEVKFVEVDYNDALEKLRNQKLDIYGPMYITSERVGRYSFTDSLGEVPMSAFLRTAKNRYIAHLPEPTSLKQIKTKNYKVAILEGSCSHDFAVNIAGLKTENIIICENPEEIAERLTLGGLKRAAHLSFCDLLTANSIKDSFPSSVKLIFNQKKTLPGYELAIAVRKDWSELTERINSSIEFLKKRNGLEDFYQKNGLEVISQ